MQTPCTRGKKRYELTLCSLMLGLCFFAILWGAFLPAKVTRSSLIPRYDGAPDLSERNRANGGNIEITKVPEKAEGDFIISVKGDSDMETDNGGYRLLLSDDGKEWQNISESSYLTIDPARILVHGSLLTEGKYFLGISSNGTRNMKPGDKWPYPIEILKSEQKRTRESDGIDIGYSEYVLLILGNIIIGIIAISVKLGTDQGKVLITKRESEKKKEHKKGVNGTLVWEDDEDKPGGSRSGTSGPKEKGGLWKKWRGLWSFKKMGDHRGRRTGRSRDGGGDGSEGGRRHVDARREKRRGRRRTREFEDRGEDRRRGRKDREFEDGGEDRRRDRRAGEFDDGGEDRRRDRRAGEFEDRGEDRRRGRKDREFEDGGEDRRRGRRAREFDDGGEDRRRDRRNREFDGRSEDGRRGRKDREFDGRGEDRRRGRRPREFDDGGEDRRRGRKDREFESRGEDKRRGRRNREFDGRGEDRRRGRKAREFDDGGEDKRRGRRPREFDGRSEDGRRGRKAREFEGRSGGRRGPDGRRDSRGSSGAGRR